MTTAGIPEVPVELVHNRDGIRDWKFVDGCPYCGKRHHHGAGPEGTDPGDYLGHRVAHCITPGCLAGYILVEAAR